MKRVAFTRDEVILALDVLYQRGTRALNPEADEILELSSLLNQLPIHLKENQYEKFRNASGVCRQICCFNSSHKNGARDPNVGALFYEIATEFENNIEYLHTVADAIRNNIQYFHLSPFGNEFEALDFPEGALLGHLHRLVEQRDSKKLAKASRCNICQLNLRELYPQCSDLLDFHLTVPITQLDGGQRYSASDFMTVCPNCHAALHRYRPWHTQENCEEILSSLSED